VSRNSLNIGKGVEGSLGGASSTPGSRASRQPAGRRRSPELVGISVTQVRGPQGRPGRPELGKSGRRLLCSGICRHCRGTTVSSTGEIASRQPSFGQPLAKAIHHKHAVFGGSCHRRNAG